jgi:hypothetical protein
LDRFCPTVLAVPLHEGFGERPQDLPREKKLEQFLTDLARHRDVSASTQNQALNAVRPLLSESDHDKGLEGNILK